MLLAFMAVVLDQAPVATPPALSPRVAVKGSFFALSVANLDATEKWYIDNLGLRRTLSLPPREGRAMRLLEGSGIIVELIKDPDARSLKSLTPPIDRDYLVHGIFKAGILVEDFEGLMKTMRERGVTIAFGPFPATREQRANAIIRDNEGNYLQLVGDYPADRPGG